MTKPPPELPQQNNKPSPTEAVESSKQSQLPVSWDGIPLSEAEIKMAKAFGFM